MRKMIQWVFLFSGLILLNACAPMNTEFSCNATAGDKCINVEEADQMSKEGITLDNLPPNASPNQKGQPPTNIEPNPNTAQRIWIAPYTDASGEYHEAHYILVGVNDNTNNDAQINEQMELGS